MVYALALMIGSVAGSLASSSTARRGAASYQPFRAPAPLNLSEHQLRAPDLQAFVRHHKPALRAPPRYFDPTRQELEERTFVMMRQAIYATQDRLKHLDPVLDKYGGDPYFRVGYIFSKLGQNLEDMRRIYTIASNLKQQKRIVFQINYYRYETKKNIETTYIVEHLNAFHDQIMKNLTKLVGPRDY